MTICNRNKFRRSQIETVAASFGSGIHDILRELYFPTSSRNSSKYGSCISCWEPIQIILCRFNWTSPEFIEWDRMDYSAGWEEALGSLNHALEESLMFCFVMGNLRNCSEMFSTIRTTEGGFGGKNHG